MNKIYKVIWSKTRNCYVADRKTQREGSYFRNRRRCRQQAGGAGAVRFAAGCVSDGRLQHARGVGRRKSSGDTRSWRLCGNC